MISMRYIAPLFLARISNTSIHHNYISRTLGLPDRTRWMMGDAASEETYRIEELETYQSCRHPD